jgi:hypothetical protein
MDESDKSIIEKILQKGESEFEECKRFNAGINDFGIQFPEVGAVSFSFPDKTIYTETRVGILSYVAKRMQKICQEFTGETYKIQDNSQRNTQNQ